MKRIAALFALAQLALVSAPLSAQALERAANETGYGSYRSVTTQSWVEEWDPAQGRWVKVADDEVGAETETLPTVVTTIMNGKAVSETRSAARYAQPVPANKQPVALAQYGPFVVISAKTAMMVGSTNARSPGQFDAMMQDFPGIDTLNMVEAPGTSNDIANLALGRKIRAAGLDTHVPHDGSVRSGAVELFLAGETRTMEDGAEFAVHSWLDNHGREADDFASNHPAHRLYLDYYVEMGMSEAQARRFYEMTNSVPHASARWLEANEMRGWLAPQPSNHHRYAARQVEATCDFCNRVDARLAETNAVVATMSFAPLALNTATPAIGYDDLTQVKLAKTVTSLLDS